jgi:hypothetical protein
MSVHSFVTSIIQLAGVDDEFIANDYALTRIGREPIREIIMNRLAMEPLFASNNEAALNMFTCRYVRRPSPLSDF